MTGAVDNLTTALPCGRALYTGDAHNFGAFDARFWWHRSWDCFLLLFSVYALSVGQAALGLRVFVGLFPQFALCLCGPLFPSCLLVCVYRFPLFLSPSLFPLLQFFSAFAFLSTPPPSPVTPSLYICIHVSFLSLSLFQTTVTVAEHLTGFP